MLRLTLLLCIGIYAALMTLGEDRGQLRPGLAKAVAEGRLGQGRNGIEAEGAVDLAAAEPAVVAMAEPEPAPPTPAVPEPLADPLPEPDPETLLASASAPLDPVASPDAPSERPVVEALEDPVFSLASLGNELVPGEAEARVATPDPVASPEPVAEAAGTIWYVNASSVNVRAAPSTEAEILGKLGTGEATLLVEQVNAEWARIVIQGDGLEGFVALRYLSPETP
jgi:hypothetical protein